MKVLVTRPLEDSRETARQLAARGHECLIAPLLTVRFEDGPPLSLEGIQAILATSANGVRALARRSDRRDIALFAVGPQTAQEAVAAGFTAIRNADGDAHRLSKAAAEWARPEAGPLLHVHGGQGAGALAAGLRRRDFTVKEEILYGVEPKPLSPEALAAVKHHKLDAALFFSPRSAQIFRDFALQEKLDVSALTAICISSSTALSLEPLAFAKTRVAAAPNQDALLECLE